MNHRGREALSEDLPLSTLLCGIALCAAPLAGYHPLKEKTKMLHTFQSHNRAGCGSKSGLLQPSVAVLGL